MKITVRIHSPTGLQFRTKKLEDDQTVVLAKPKKDKAGWRPKVTHVEVRHGWFGRAKFYADIFPDAESTFRYDYDKRLIDQPTLTKDQVKQFGSWDALRRRSKPPEGGKPGNMVLFLIAILVIANIAVTILMVSGRLRI